jgi:hypothetical protein
MPLSRGHDEELVRPFPQESYDRKKSFDVMHYEGRRAEKHFGFLLHSL